MKSGNDETLSVAFYNVENTFDPADDPAIDGDDDFTPHGAMKWTQERFDRKLQALARAICAMNDMKGPDILGVCEIENRHVLERLVNEFLPKGAYAIVHTDSPDPRGMDVGILYRQGKFGLKGFVAHRVQLGAGRNGTRDILEAAFLHNRRTLTVLANHWPSRRGSGNLSSPDRIAAAQVAAGVIDSLYRIDAQADILFMGDFNDVPLDSSIYSVLGARPFGEPASRSARLVNMASSRFGVRSEGSYYFRDHLEMLDQIMLSRGAFDSVGLMSGDSAQSVFKPSFLTDDRDPLHPQPRHTYRGDMYIGGTSDHYPVTLRVRWRDR